MMTAANRETAVLAVQTVKEVSNMGNRPVNRSRRSAGRGRYSSGRSRSGALRRRRRNRRLKNVLIGLCCILLVVLLVFGVGKLVERFAGPGKTQLRKEGIEKLNSGDLEGAVADFDQALERQETSQIKPLHLMQMCCGTGQKRKCFWQTMRQLPTPMTW